jgi:predicted ArsR family transcriptional regulator
MDIEAVAAVAALADPLRRRAYDVVAGAREPIGRDEVAARLEIGRTLAAFHLDKLVAAGLLVISYARLSGRTGPGAGRPAKLYQRSPVPVEVSLPPRAYRDVATLLAETVERAGAEPLLAQRARQRGAEIGAALKGRRGVLATLADQGYEPVRAGGAIRLGNCPFETVAREFPAVVCGMNLALVEGLVDAAGWSQWEPVIDPDPEGCCVILQSKNKKH